MTANKILNDGRTNTRNTNNRNKTHSKPEWERRLESKISVLRTEVGQISHHLLGKLSSKKQQKLKLNNKGKEEIEEILDTKKQKLQALSKRLRRYKKSNQRRKDNKNFETNQKMFYRNLNNEQKIENPPDINDITQFWKNIWSNPVEHSEHPEWVEVEKEATKDVNEMQKLTIEPDDVTLATKKLLNWKAPGPDKIHNYWLKYFTSTHEPQANIFNNLIQDPNSTPNFFTHGITY